MLTSAQANHFFALDGVFLFMISEHILQRFWFPHRFAVLSGLLSHTWDVLDDNDVIRQFNIQVSANSYLRVNGEVRVYF